MKRVFRGLLLFIALISVPVFAAGGDPNVSAEARVLKSRIRIGDEVRLLLTVEYPRKYSVTPPSEKLDLSPFEIKKIEPDPVRKGQNRIRETFRLVLTTFQTGDLKIPPITLRYTDEEGDPGQTASEPVQVKVVSVGKKLTDKDDIRPIKAPVSVGLFRFWTGTASVAAALLSILLAVLIARRKIRQRREAESRKPPHERVKIELHRLKDHGYLEEKNHKAFYSELSDILRRYLERRFQVEALERTSSELLEELEDRAFKKDILDAIHDVLTESDLVKFAKLTPPFDMSTRLESRLLEAVERTKPRPEEKKK